MGTKDETHVSIEAIDIHEFGLLGHKPSLTRPL